MTDEEKALASFKKNYCPYCDNKMDCDISLVDCTSYDTMYRQSYLEGLAEGRKEKCFEQNKDGTIRPCEVMKVCEEIEKDAKVIAKENEDLKEQLKKQSVCTTSTKRKSRVGRRFCKTD